MSHENSIFFQNGALSTIFSYILPHRPVFEALKERQRDQLEGISERHVRTTEVLAWSMSDIFREKSISGRYYPPRRSLDNRESTNQARADVKPSVDMQSKH